MSCSTATTAFLLIIVPTFFFHMILHTAAPRGDCILRSITLQVCNAQSLLLDQSIPMHPYTGLQSSDMACIRSGPNVSSFAATDKNTILPRGRRRRRFTQDTAKSDIFLAARPGQLFMHPFTLAHEHQYQKKDDLRPRPEAASGQATVIRHRALGTCHPIGADHTLAWTVRPHPLRWVGPYDLWWILRIQYASAHDQILAAAADESSWCESISHTWLTLQEKTSTGQQGIRSKS